MSPNNSIVSYKLIPEFPGYLASDDGTIWTCWEKANNGKGKRCAFVRFVKEWREVPIRVQHGYPIVCIRNKVCTVHTLVLLSFIGPCPEGMEGCHNDGSRNNNRLENLRWDTHSNNIRDAIKHGAFLVGEKHHQAKLTEDKVRQIRIARKEGRTLSSIAKEHEVTVVTIHNIMKRKIWYHVV